MTSSPHRATITVEWSPSASTGEPEAIRGLLEDVAEQIGNKLHDYGTVEPSVRLAFLADRYGPNEHAYLSTACWHATNDPDLTDDDRAALHRLCRRACKYGGEHCVCACGHTGIEDRPGRELHRGPTLPPLTYRGDGSLVLATVDLPPGSTIVVYAAADPDVCEPCAHGNHGGCGGCRCADRGHYGLHQRGEPR